MKDTERAQGAYQRVKEAEKAGKPFADTYGRLCLRFPALVHQNGLCLALAFLESKAKGDSKTAFSRLARDIAEVTGVEGDFGGTVRGASTPAYVRLTEEVMRTAVYFKRYAEAILKVDPTDDERSRNG